MVVGSLSQPDRPLRSLQTQECEDSPQVVQMVGTGCANFTAAAVVSGRYLGLSCNSSLAEMASRLPLLTLGPDVDGRQSLLSLCCRSCRAVPPPLPSVGMAVCTGELLRSHASCCGDEICSAETGETQQTCSIDCAQQASSGWLLDWIGADNPTHYSAAGGEDENGRYRRPASPETTFVFYASIVLLIVPTMAYALFVHLKYFQLHKHVSAWIQQRGNTGAKQLTPRVNSGPKDTFENSAYEHVQDVTTGGCDLKLSVAYLNYWVDLPQSVADTLRKVPPTRKRLLTDIFATFKPGNLTAILGATGAGKTTLLNLISHRARMGEFSGLRMLNGVPTENATYKAIMRQQGYVTQTCENFFEDLTIHDTLLYAAMMGLPVTMKLETKLERIAKCLSELGLSAMAQDRMDQVTFRTKKRVSIAVELLRQPALLMLDEPTTGLDATASLQLIQTLHKLAITGNRTVVCVIHQPRSDIFTFVDEVLLLAKGGRMVYAGSVEKAVDEIREGIPNLDYSKYKNPGDFIIDAIGLDPEADEVAEAGESSSHLAERYKKSSAFATSVQGIAHDLHASGAAGAAEPLRDTSFGDFATDFWCQIWVLSARRIRREMVNPGGQVAYWIGSIAAVVMMAQCFSYYPPENEGLVRNADGGANTERRCNTASGHCTADLPYRNLMFLFMTSYLAFMLQYLFNVPLYFGERQVLIRERLSGVVRFSAYAVSGLVAEAPIALFFGISQVVTSHMLVPLNSDDYYPSFCVVLLTVGLISWQGNVALASCATDVIEAAYAFMFMVVGTGLLTGGLSVTYSYIPWYFKALGLYYVSMPAVAYRVLIVNDFVGHYLQAPCNLVWDKSSQYALFVAPGDIEQHVMNYSQTVQDTIVSFSSVSTVGDFVNAPIAGLSPILAQRVTAAQQWLQTQPQYHDLENTPLASLAGQSGAGNISDSILQEVNGTVPAGAETVKVDANVALGQAACESLAGGDEPGFEIP
eukprot:COSAG05_NODE_1296_length_5247_cov_2.705517_2_plen_980_part_00